MNITTTDSSGSSQQKWSSWQKLQKQSKFDNLFNN